jgi:hypothetical protein
MRRGVRAALVVGVVWCSACSGGSSSDGAPTASTSELRPSECAASAPVLAVDQIAAAVAAVEAELGGPQEYFEINATPALVNLFVADTASGSVTPYAYASGGLTSEASIAGAAGATFVAAAIQIDPQRVLSCVASQLPDSVPDVFFVEGGAGGAVKYTVLTSNDLGGQLVIEVSATGLVIGVDAI